MPLTPSDFPAFFSALWWPDAPERGAPFDWQERLLERVVSEGWPSTLDLPTGSGKTAVLEIALFALALDAGAKPEARRQARRIVLVVDRRTVVDQAYRRAVRIAEALRRPRHAVIERVASALRALQADATALPVLPAILRGGMPRETEWARSPDQPVLLVSTVDQVGSRLLFRGYGVSDRMKPVHAGLLGCDSLYLLDEVHLSRPFEETLGAVSAYMRSARVERPLPRPLTVVRMSATVAERPSDVFSIGVRDRENSVLASRLRAVKRAELREIATPRDPARAREAIAKACVTEVERIAAKSTETRVAALIVNRVDTARRAAELAGEKLGSAWDVELMTGRMRPLDRADLERRLLSRVAAEPGRRKRLAEADRPLLVVSTQAIEAGADFDFDALVTECASLDALRQRFGRLDRLGELGKAHAAIVAGSSDVSETAEPDPVYGESLSRTWHWLVEQARQAGEEPLAVDFGIDALDARLAALGSEERARLLSPRPFAPVLLPSHLERWVQTSPAPSANPDVAPFLHGTERGAPDVYVVWRADVSEDDLRAGAAGADGESDAVPASVLALLDVAPPSALEALAVPLWAARSWLAERERRPQGGEPLPAPAVADVEGEKDEQAPVALISPVIAWRGEKTRTIVNGLEILPGDTLVVPSKYGGLGARFSCWDPSSIEPVRDRGDEAQLLHRARAVVRLGQDVLQGWLADANLASKPQAGDHEDRGPEELREDFESWREAVLSAEQTPAWARIALNALGQGYELVVDGPPRACFSRRRVPRGDLARLIETLAWHATPDGLEPATEDDGGSFTDVDVTLSRHLAGVRDFASGFARALALAEDVASDLELAGWLHDLGKADPRFQLMLHGADPVAEAVAEEPLAKSKVALRGRAARERVRSKAGYPRGARHELMSVALVEHSEAIRARARDWDLVLHLVASHHGYCRPFAPPVLDRDPREVRVELEGVRLQARSDHRLARIDSLVTERFWTLVERYGFWGLAWLESILRLADHRESEKEAGNG